MRLIVFRKRGKTKAGDAESADLDKAQQLTGDIILVPSAFQKPKAMAITDAMKARAALSRGCPPPLPPSAPPRPLPPASSPRPRSSTQEEDVFHKVRMVRADMRLFGTREKNRLVKAAKEAKRGQLPGRGWAAGAQGLCSITESYFTGIRT